MRGGKIPTINDVAKKAGVSASTVSRALHEHASIPTATREKILRQAKLLGYRCNPVFSEMMSSIRARQQGSKVSLAYLTNERSEYGWREIPTFCCYIEEATRRATELGFGLDVVWTRERGMTAERLTRILTARGIQGILLGPSFRSRGHLSLDWKRFSTVAIGHSVYEPRVHRIVNNQKKTIEVALRNVWKAGYRKPALFLSKWQNTRCDLNFTAGYFAWAFERMGKIIPPVLFQKMDEAITRKWIQKYQPDIIFGSGVDPFRFLKSIDPRVGSKIGYVDLDISTVDLSRAGMMQNHPAIAAAAVDLLIQQILHGERGIPAFAKMVMIEGTWVDGDSVKRVQNSATIA